MTATLIYQIELRMLSKMRTFAAITKKWTEWQNYFHK